MRGQRLDGTPSMAGDGGDFKPDVAGFRVHTPVGGQLADEVQALTAIASRIAIVYVVRKARTVVADAADDMLAIEC
jgi:hypothetical protein